MNKKNKLLGYILLIILIQLVLWPNFGTLDTTAFVSFAESVAHFGIRGGYAHYNLYYPPLPTVFIAPFVKASNYLTLGPEIKILVLKIFLAFFYYLTASIIVIIEIKKGKTREAALATLLIFLANPAIIETTTILSYFDILMFPALLFMCFYLQKKKYFLSGFFLSIAFMTKLLPILLLPLFLTWFIEYKNENSKRHLRILWKEALSGILGIVLTTTLIAWYFDPKQIHTILTISSDHGQWLSFAYNIPRIIREWRNDNAASELIRQTGKLLFFAVSAGILINTIKKQKTMENLARAGAGIFLVYFFLLTGVHENHIFPALIMSFIACMENANKQNKRLLWIISVLTFINLFIPYGFGYFENLGYTGLFLFWHFAIGGAGIWYLAISLISVGGGIMALKNILSREVIPFKSPTEKTGE